MIERIRSWRSLRDQPLLRNTSWLLAGQGFSVALQAVYFVVLARLLGAAQYGIFVGAFALTNILAQYSSLGTGMVLLRYVSIHRSVFAVYWGNVLLATAGIGSLLTLTLPLLGHHVLNSSSAALVAVAAISSCVCAQVTTETGRVCRAFEQMRIAAGLNFLTSLMRTIAAAVLLLFLHEANAWQWAVASLSVSAIGMVIAMIVVTVRFGLPRFEFSVLRRHGAEGLGYSFAQSTTSLYNDVDKTMLSSFGLNQANGIYTIAYRIIDIATIPIFSLHDAALPKFFQLGVNGISDGRKIAIRILRKAVPFAGLTAVILFFAAPIVPRFAGAGFTESVGALRWLCLIPVFRSVHNISGAALTGAGLQRFRTGSQIFSAVLNFALNLWAIPHYGWQGAAWSSLITDGSLAALNWILLLKLQQKGHLYESSVQASTVAA